MFVLSSSILWSFVFFFAHTYLILFFSMLLYSIPSIKEILNYSKLKNIKNFEYLTGFDVFWLLITPLFLILIINLSWSNYPITAWFGGIIFFSFQSKIFYLILSFFFLILLVYVSSFYFSSKEVYDYSVVNFNFFFWTLFLFTSNTVFTVIFFIEIISTLIFLLVVTSTFSSTYFYNNLNLNTHSYFHQTTPFFFLQTLMYFFWISLLSSLNLFFFLILFYTKILTFDWFLFEFIFFYVVEVSQIKDVFFLSVIWFNLLFSIFLKCGLVPFYFWKPTFFKGLPLHTLFFYIIFFYFFILLFFLFFFLNYLNEIFYFFLNINVLLLIIGFVVLLFTLCEAYYIKSFLALSSILNTLFVFLTISSNNVYDFFFFL